jgi:hypothetical protein
MVGAAYAVLFYSTVLQRSATVRAVAVEQAKMTGKITKQHQLLAEDFDRNRNVPHLFRQSHRPPETSQVIASEGARAHVRYIIPG